jgi:hypothetical protein
MIQAIQVRDDLKSAGRQLDQPVHLVLAPSSVSAFVAARAAQVRV